MDAKGGCLAWWSLAGAVGFGWVEVWRLRSLKLYGFRRVGRKPGRWLRGGGAPGCWTVPRRTRGLIWRCAASGCGVSVAERWPDMAEEMRCGGGARHAIARMPWSEGTSSWVEPTAWALLALGVAGEGGSERAMEGRCTLWAREIGGEGWNYGSSSVFGTPRRPMPENTGLALEAPAGRAGPTDVAGSMRKLETWVEEGCGTPFPLAHAILAMAAWGRRPADSESKTAAAAYSEAKVASPDLWCRLADRI